jgi:hypothetical protein
VAAPTPSAPEKAAFDAGLFALEAAKPCKDKDANDEKLECLTEAATTLVTTLENNTKLKDSERREAFDKFHKNSLKRSIADCMSVRGQRTSGSPGRCIEGRYGSRFIADRVGSCNESIVEDSKQSLSQLNLKITRSMQQQLLDVESKQPIIEQEVFSAKYECGERTKNYGMQMEASLEAKYYRSRVLPVLATDFYENYMSILNSQFDEDDSFHGSFKSSLDRFYVNPINRFADTFDSNIGDLSQLMSMDKYYTNDLSESPWSIYQARSSSGLRGITPSEILARYSNTVVKEPTFIPVYSGSATPLYESESTRSRNPRVSGRIRE